MWAASEPDNYQYSIYNGCMMVFKSEVIVLFGTPHLKIDPEDKSLATSELGIDSLFLIVDKALNEANSLNVKYHEKYGFPKNIEIDWGANTLDDECFYSVKNFELL